jgi:glucose-1-phosphate thymidylyltransferase
LRSPSNAIHGRAPDDALSFLLFPVEHPELFDSVTTGKDGRVSHIDVKAPQPRSHWIWGAFRMPGAVFHELHRLWEARGRRDEYIGTLVNAWIAGGGRAVGVRAGSAYVDVGTLHGYREAMQLLSGPTPDVANGLEDSRCSGTPTRAPGRAPIAADAALTSPYSR